jgi:hypothetical protein
LALAGGLAAAASPVRHLEILALDLRLAARGIAKRPSVAAVATLSSGLGIAVTVAVFTILNASLLRPLGVPDEDSLAYLAQPTLSYANQEFLRRAAPSLTIAASRFVPGVVLEGGAEPVPAEVVSPDYFQALRLHPRAGRWFETPDENAAHEGRPVVVSHRLWRSRFASSPGLVGELLRLGTAHARVVAVAPAGFRGVVPHMPADLWLVAIRGLRQRLWAARGPRRGTAGRDGLEAGARWRPRAARASAAHRGHASGTRQRRVRPRGRPLDRRRWH